MVTRMFPRESVTWVNKVHEHPACQLPTKQLAGYLGNYLCFCNATYVMLKYLKLYELQTKHGQV